MASLEKRPGGSFRIAFCWGGSKHTASLRTRSRRAAEACRSRLEDNLHRLKLGTLIVPDGVDLFSFLISDGRISVKSDAAASSLGNPKTSLTLTVLKHRYFDSLPEGNLEKSTIAAMRIHCDFLEKHFGKALLIGNLTLTDLQSYVEKRSHDDGLYGRKVSPVTIKKAIVTLRTIWNWARHHQLIDRPFPSKGLRYPKGAEKAPFRTFSEVERRAAKATVAEASDLWESVFLSVSEIAELLQFVKDSGALPVVYPLFVLAAHTGARRSEMIRMKWTDVDFEGGLVTLHERKKSHEKRTTRFVPMSPLLREALSQWRNSHPGGDHVFTHSDVYSRRKKGSIKGTPLTADQSYDQFKLTLKNSKWNRLKGWHVFRHSFCSNCAAKRIDQRMIDAWAGHLSEDMVRRYRHLLPDQQLEAISKVFGDAP
jgi:integrase